MRNLLMTLMIAAGLCVPAAQVLAAQANTKTTVKKKTTAKKTNKKATKKKATTKKKAQPEKAASTNGLDRTNFSCTQKQNFSVYKHPKDDSYVVMNWQNKNHRLTKVTTTTGAERYENKASGLTWVNIPAKSMLLDSKKGKQLANDCRNPQQEQMLKASTKKEAEQPKKKSFFF